MATTARTGEIPCQPPFDLGLSLQFLCGFAPMQDEQAVERGVLTQALMVNGRGVVARVFQPHSEGERGDGPRLRYALACEGAIDDATEAAAVEGLASFLSTSEDLGPFYALTERDPALWRPAARRLRGLHHVKFPSPFEAACWGVTNQRAWDWLRAQAMKSALVRRSSARASPSTARPSGPSPEAATVAAYGEGGARGAARQRPKSQGDPRREPRAFAAVGPSSFATRPRTS